MQNFPRHKLLFLFSIFTAANLSAGQMLSPPKSKEAVKVLPSPLPPKLSVIAFGRFNFVESRESGNSLIAIGAGAQVNYALTPDTLLSAAVDIAPAYGYILTTEGQRKLPPFNERAFLSQFYIKQNLGDHITLQLGKFPYSPSHDESPVPFGPASNPLTLDHEYFFERYAASVDFHSQDKSHYLNLFVGEAQDGFYDIDLQTEGVLVGVKAHSKVSENVDLHGSMIYHKLENTDDFLVAALGTSVTNADKTLKAYIRGSYFENDPYRIDPNVTHFAAEGGVICYPSRANEFGIVGTCIEREQSQVMVYWKRNLTPTTSIKGYIGYRIYEDNARENDFYKSIFDQAKYEDGLFGGFTVDIIESIGPMIDKISKLQPRQR